MNFITGAGGFLQSILFGWGGIRILDDELFVNPILPPSTDAMIMRGIHYRDGSLQIEFNATTIAITPITLKSALSVQVQSGNVLPLTAENSIYIPLQPFTVK